MPPRLQHNTRPLTRLLFPSRAPTDPTQTTTSAYLSSTDPSNTASLTVTATTGAGGGSGGAASGVRMSAMALVAAFALSFLML